MTLKRYVRTAIIMLLIIDTVILVKCEEPERIIKFETYEVFENDITCNSVILKIAITDIGTKAIQQHGLLLSETPEPNLNLENTVEKSLGSASIKGIFEAQFTGLKANTTYYFRAFVVSESGPQLGEIKQFSTKDSQAPEVEAGSISSLSMTSATLNGEVISDGGIPSTIHGICWGLSANPTINHCIDTTINGSGLGSFYGSMTGLAPGTQYYVRAYATNSKGTSYNNYDIIFKTHSLPVVTTSTVSDVTETSAISGGEVTDDGGVEVISRGVCWSTTTNPTIDLTTKTSDGVGEGTFTSLITGLTQGEEYYLKAYATNQYGTSYGTETSFTTLYTIPTAITGSATSITATSATLTGTVNANGNSTTVTFEYGLTTEYGLEANAIQNPVTGSVSTSISANIIGLTASTTYHYRVKAVSTGGTTYGDDKEFNTSTPTTVSDYDGNTYNIITIGSQDWIQENLKTTHYNNGDIIANITDNTEWSGLTSGAYCWYDNDEGTYKDTYGALYNWYAVNTGKLCPAGWHVPTDAEWTTMENYLIANGYNYDGTTTDNKIAKALASTTLWISSTNTGAVGNTDYPAKRNASGFTALPGGYRYYWDGTFLGISSFGYWGSATENSTSVAWKRGMFYYAIIVLRSYITKESGFSVRCIKD